MIKEMKSDLIDVRELISKLKNDLRTSRNGELQSNTLPVISSTKTMKAENKMPRIVVSVPAD
jgi:hypothetical protein